MEEPEVDPERLMTLFSVVDDLASTGAIKENDYMDLCSIFKTAYNKLRPNTKRSNDGADIIAFDDFAMRIEGGHLYINMENRNIFNINFVLFYYLNCNFASSLMFMWFFCFSVYDAFAYGYNILDDELREFYFNNMMIEVLKLFSVSFIMGLWTSKTTNMMMRWRAHIPVPQLVL